MTKVFAVLLVVLIVFVGGEQLGMYKERTRTKTLDEIQQMLNQTKREYEEYERMEREFEKQVPRGGRIIPPLPTFKIREIEV